jgi:hypothetical protein
MSEVSSRMYSGALDNITNTLKWSVDRKDRQAQQGIENQRRDQQDTRLAESDARQKTLFDQQQQDRDRELEKSFFNGATVADRDGTLHDYYEANRDDAAKYASKLKQAGFSIEQMRDDAANTTMVANLIGQLTSLERRQVLASEGLYNRSGLYILPPGSLPNAEYAAFSRAAIGSMDKRIDPNTIVKREDGSTAKYILNTQGRPMVGELITRQSDGAVSWTVQMEVTNPDGTKRKENLPVTELGSSANDAPLAFRTAADFEDRARGQRIGAGAALFSANLARLDPAYAKESIRKSEVRALDTTDSQAEGAALKKGMALWNPELSNMANLAAIKIALHEEGIPSKQVTGTITALTDIKEPKKAKENITLAEGAMLLDSNGKVIKKNPRTHAPSSGGDGSGRSAKDKPFPRHVETALKDLKEATNETESVEPGAFAGQPDKRTTRKGSEASINKRTKSLISSLQLAVRRGELSAAEAVQIGGGEGIGEDQIIPRPGGNKKALAAPQSMADHLGVKY